MDKEEATKTLAKELGDKLGRLVVLEGLYKDSLLKNALVIYQTGNPINLDFYDHKFQGHGNGENVADVLPSSFTKETNYLFLENIQMTSSQYGGGKSRFAVTPYALIGEKEISALRRMFYKNVPFDISHAMNTLKIENFVDLYETYAHKPDHLLFTITKKDLEEMERFINFAEKITYDKDNEVNTSKFEPFGGVASLNAHFKKVGISGHLDNSGATSNSYIRKEIVSYVVGRLSKLMKDTKHKYCESVFREFMEFVFFYLPDEDRNIESDKQILKNILDLDFVVNILSKEYVKGSSFCPYFEVLDKGLQIRIVETLKNFPEKKPFYNSFLWSQGFKDVDLDYLVMYQKNSEGFIEYFTTKTIEEKKVILKDIMDNESVNERVINWLNENEPELIREVSFNE